MIFIAINPTSGGNKGKNLLAQFRREAPDIDVEFVIHNIFDGDLLSKISEINSCDLCIIAGGDGTIHHTINAFSGFPIPIFIIPLGTGNDLARELKISRSVGALSLREILALIKTAQLQPIQSWRFSFSNPIFKELLFCNYLSFGFDGAVIRSFHQIRERFTLLPKLFGRFGNRLAYAISTVFNMFKSEGKVTVKLEKEVTQRKLLNLFFANIRSVTGLGLSNHISDPSDELLEGLAIRSFYQYFPFLTGRFLYKCNPEIIEKKSEWSFELVKKTYVQIDGEPIGDLICGSCKIIRGPIVNFLTLKGRF